MTAVTPAAPVEWELDAQGARTGRWRRRQYYADRAPDGTWLRNAPSLRRACEWRTGSP